jgi:hypothetical protein
MKRNEEKSYSDSEKQKKRKNKNHLPPLCFLRGEDEVSRA